MSGIIGGIFDHADRVQMESMTQRMMRHQVVTANITNSETPGYRALGYNFEEQLQALSSDDSKTSLKATNPKHFINQFTEADGNVKPEVFVRPTESIGEDGNTVDVDFEMAQLAHNQILYRAAAELISKKIGMLRYAIREGR